MIFLDDTNSTSNESKNKQVGLYQMEKVLYSNGNKMKTQPKEKEKILAKDLSDKGLISRKYQNSYNSTIKN